MALGDSINYGAGGDADVGKRAIRNLENLIPAANPLASPDAMSARSARLAQIRARRATGTIAQQAAQAEKQAQAAVQQLPPSQLALPQSTGGAGSLVSGPGNALAGAPLTPEVLTPAARAQVLGPQAQVLSAGLNPLALPPGAGGGLDLGGAFGGGGAGGPVNIGAATYTQPAGIGAATPALGAGAAPAAESSVAARMAAAAGGPSGIVRDVTGSGAPTAESLLQGIGSTGTDAARLAETRAAAAAAQSGAAGMAGTLEGAVGAGGAGGAANVGKLGAMFGEGGRFAAGGLGRAGLYGLAGYAGGRLVHSLWDNPNTAADSALSGALTGAGIGAGIGSVVPVIGTGIGAGVGALAGGLIGEFGPKHTGPKAVEKAVLGQSDQLATIMDKLGINDPDLRQQVHGQLWALSQGAKSDAEVQAAAKQIASQLPTIAQQALQQRQQDALNAHAQMTMQALYGPLLQDALSGTRQTGRDSQLAYEQLAREIEKSNPTMAAAYRTRGAAGAQAAEAQALAAAQQMALAPYATAQNTANQITQRTNQDITRQTAAALAKQALQQQQQQQQGALVGQG